MIRSEIHGFRKRGSNCIGNSKENDNRKALGVLDVGERLYRGMFAYVAVIEGQLQQ